MSPFSENFIGSFLKIKFLSIVINTERKLEVLATKHLNIPNQLQTDHAQHECMPVRKHMLEKTHWSYTFYFNNFIHSRFEEYVKCYLNMSSCCDKHLFLFHKFTSWHFGEHTPGVTLLAQIWNLLKQFNHNVLKWFMFDCLSIAYSYILIFSIGHSCYA